MVEEVAPAADRLRQQKRRHDDVEPFDHIKVVAFGVDVRCQCCADERTVDGQAAGGRVEDHQPALISEARPFEDDVVDARKGDAHDHTEDNHVPHVFGVMAALCGAVGSPLTSNHGAAHDEHAVPAQRDFERA